MTRQRRREGFTLIEVLLVVGILVALGTVGVVVYMNIQAGTDEKIARTLVDNTEDAVKMYSIAMGGGKVPDEETGLQALITAPEDEDEAANWKRGGGPWIQEIPKDPWGNELKYATVDDEGAPVKFKVYSMGPDGEDGTEDDISSYTPSEDQM